MSRNEIIVLLAVIILSTTFICLFLNSVFKSPKPAKEKPSEKEDPKKDIKEEIKEVVKEEQEKVVEEEKVEEKKEEPREANFTPPPISIALQDELNEFRNYLKSRIAPESSNKVVLHPYDTPKVNRFDNNFDDFYKPNRFKDFDMDDFDMDGFGRGMPPLPDDFGFDGEAFDREYDEFNFGRRKPASQDVNLHNLPDKIKILLFTNFFDTKY